MTRQEAMALREEVNRVDGWQVEVRYDARGQDYYVAGVRRNDERQWLFESRAAWEKARKPRVVSGWEGMFE